MAFGKSLELRKIQPKLHPAGLAATNPERRFCVAEAKKLNISTKRFKKMRKRSYYPKNRVGNGENQTSYFNF